MCYYVVDVSALNGHFVWIFREDVQSGSSTWKFYVKVLSRGPMWMMCRNRSM